MLQCREQVNDTGDAAMLARVEQYVQSNRLAGQGDRLLVGVSGGADSVALLLVLHELAERHSFALVVAHLNHGFRGEEAAEDSRFVKELSARLGIACECGYTSVPTLLMGRNASPQVVAREERFRFFKGVMEKHALHKLALAHHQDDQAETVLLRLIRGTGMRGLRGMSPHDHGLFGISIIRPFLAVSQKEVLEYLAARGQQYRTDSSNLGTEYSRNFLRHVVMPELCKINHEAPVALDRLARQVAIDMDYLEGRVLLELAEAVEPLGLGVGVKLTHLRKLHQALSRRLLMAAYRQIAGEEDHSLEAVHLAAVEDLIGKQPGRRVVLPAMMCALRTREHIVFYHSHAEEGVPYCLTLPVPGEEHLPCGGTVTAVLVDAWPPDFAARTCYEAYLSWTSNIITVRNRRPHDAYIPLGALGHKKVKQAMSEAGIPLPWRANWPIIEVMGQVAWVPGLRVAHRYRAMPEGPILRLTYKRGGN